VRAIVLVGGEGTRLRPLTYTTPKPLLPIANQPFLERQLSWLDRHGIDEVVLSLGYLPDAFAARFPDGRFGNLTLRYAVEDEPLGTAGGIRYAAEVAGIDERFVVCNGDVLTTLDLTEMVAFHDAHGGEATIHLCRVDDPSAFGVVPTRTNGEVMAFVEKPPAGRAPSHWINAGTYVLEPAVLERIPPRLTVSVERETFPRMLDHAGNLYALQSDAYWIDIGTPEKYLQAHADVLAGALGTPPAPGAVEAAPGVWEQGSVSIAPDAQVEGPVLLGPGVSIASGARVSGSVLGPGCAIGEQARVARSVVLQDGCVANTASVLDAVIGAEATLERGAVAAGGTVVGPSVVVAAGSRRSGARVPQQVSTTP
jgi:NDP-sugar pyrophosphorylase family protein